MTQHTPAEAVQYWYDAATERREDRDRLRAVVARIGQMADAWEQQLPEVIRTPAVVSAIRAALEPAAMPAPTDQTAVRAAALHEGAEALLALDPIEAALAGQHAWADAAALLRRLAGEAQQDEKPSYPHPDGDVIILGPEVFASPDGRTISWKGANYERQPARVAQQDPTQDGEALVHVGWWCWRGDNHVPAEWADDMRAVLQRIEDGDDEPGTDEPEPR